MRTFRYECEQRLPRGLHEVFAFFSDPANLERITPPWLSFSILRSSTPTIERGTTIDYRLRVRGIPLRWTSVIAVWEPPHRFVDEQVRGPYRRWVHTHSFTAEGPHTLVRDDVEYAVLGGALVDRLFVRRDIDKIFAHRRVELERIFA
jgi:hypothetical protein